MLKQWTPFVVGVVTFLAAHAIEVARWTAWFGGVYDPWFLNSGRAILFTTGCLFVAGVMVGGLVSSSWPRHAMRLAAGAFVAMAVVMVVSPSGGGTIFPLVLVFGAVFSLVSSVTGVLAGYAVRRVLGTGG
jgi:hypothetical protein